MASDKEYMEFITEQFSGVDGVSGRAMMGEYVLYYRGKVFGGIYDNRFLVKITKSSLDLMPKAARELPYEGGSEMLLVDDVENREFLAELFEAMYDELPQSKKKVKK
ncbi:MAG: TfoX/Sxy family protein [Clostridia bacterium]|nr:TfoX/Sxy family protein [Clostridia bacterium]